jgi:hypothetical protein
VVTSSSARDSTALTRALLRSPLSAAAYQAEMSTKIAHRRGVRRAAMAVPVRPSSAPAATASPR